MPLSTHDMGNDWDDEYNLYILEMKGKFNMANCGIYGGNVVFLLISKN